MIINGLEDVRFTLNEGAWVDDKIIREDSDAVRVKLRFARLNFATQRPSYSAEGSPARLALQNGGRFVDGIEEAIFHIDLCHRYDDGSGTDWSKEHPLMTAFTMAELVMLGGRAIRGYYVSKDLYSATSEVDVEVFRQELNDLSELHEVPEATAFRDLAADTEAMQGINDGVTEISEATHLNNMVTAGFIARAVSDYLRS